MSATGRVLPRALALVLLCCCLLSPLAAAQQPSGCRDSVFDLVACGTTDAYYQCLHSHLHPTRRAGLCGCTMAPYTCTLSKGLCGAAAACEATADKLGCGHEWCAHAVLGTPRVLRMRYTFTDSYDLRALAPALRAYLGYVPGEWVGFIPQVDGSLEVSITLPRGANVNAAVEDDVRRMLETMPGKMAAASGVQGRSSLFEVSAAAGGGGHSVLARVVAAVVAGVVFVLL